MNYIFFKLNTILNKFLLFLWKFKIMNHISELVERGNKIVGKQTKIMLYNKQLNTSTEIDIIVEKIYDYAINGCVMADVKDLKNNQYTIPLASIILHCEAKGSIKTKQENFSSKKMNKIITYTLMSREVFNNIDASIGFKVFATYKINSLNTNDYNPIGDKIYSSHEDAFKDGWKSLKQLLAKNDK